MRSRPECWAPKSGSGQTFPAGSGLWKELCGFRQTPHLQHCFLLSENGEFSLLPSDSWLPGPECHQKQNAVDILGNPELWILILALLARTACVALAASPLHLGHARLCIHGGSVPLAGFMWLTFPPLSSSRLSLEAQLPLLPMGSCQAGHNVQLCLAHHPPLVCATLILLLLGLSGLGLGGYLLTHRSSLRSPDIPQVSTPLPGPILPPPRQSCTCYPSPLTCCPSSSSHTGLGLLSEVFWPADPVPREWDSHSTTARLSCCRLTDHVDFWG